MPTETGVQLASLVHFSQRWIQSSIVQKYLKTLHCTNHMHALFCCRYSKKKHLEFILHEIQAT